MVMSHRVMMSILVCIIVPIIAQCPDLVILRWDQLVLPISNASDKSNLNFIWFNRKVKTFPDLYATLHSFTQ